MERERGTERKRTERERGTERKKNEKKRDGMSECVCV